MSSNLHSTFEKRAHGPTNPPNQSLSRSRLTGVSATGETFVGPTGGLFSFREMMNTAKRHSGTNLHADREQANFVFGKSFIRLDRRLYESPAFRSIPLPAQAVLIDFISLWRVAERETIAFPWAACSNPQVSERVFRDAIQRLVADGFLDRCASTGLANSYRPSSRWMTAKATEKTLSRMAAKQTRTTGKRQRFTHAESAQGKPLTCAEFAQGTSAESALVKPLNPCGIEADNPCGIEAVKKTKRDLIPPPRQETFRKVGGGGLDF